MKKLLLISGIVLSVLTSYSQTVKKEYYDAYTRTKLMAQYQVNSVGEKHGWFKGFDRQGVTVYEYNYKNNQWNGINKEYTTIYGSRTLSKSESYKAGVLNGPAKYYATTLDGKTTTVIKDGNYLDGERQGKWMILTVFNNYDLTAEQKKGARYIKSYPIYDKGEQVFSDGEHNTTYYPSGKPHSIQPYKGGKKTGYHKWYFPNGQLSYEAKYSTDGKNYLFQKNYHNNGQLKSHTNWEGPNTTYEGYDKDGNPDRETQYEKYKIQGVAELKKRNFAEARELFRKGNSDEDAITMGYLAEGKALYEKGNYGGAITKVNKARRRASNPVIEEFYEEVYAKYVEWLDGLFGRTSDEYTIESMEKELRNQKQDLKDSDYVRYSNIVSTIKNLESDIRSAIESYKKENVKRVSTIMVDAQGKPIMKDSYPKGKHLYLKSVTVLEQYIKEYREESDLEKKKTLGKKVTDAFDILNKIPESEFKTLNKQLKKIDDQEQIKSILGI